MEVNVIKLKRELELARMTTEDLADAIDRSPQAIYWIYKNAKTSMDTLADIGKALGIDPKDLLI